MGRVVHVSRDPYDVYIGRANRRTGLSGSVWANPFRIGAPHPGTGEPIQRGEAVELYKEWIVRGEGLRLLKRLGELEGKTLGCWCARSGGVGAHEPLICHGQVLLLLLEHRRCAMEKKRAIARCAEALGPRWHEQVPVHRYYDTHDPRKTLNYCDDCKLHDPAGVLLYAGPAPEGARCDDCEIRNPPRSGDAPRDERSAARYLFCGSRGWTDPGPIRERLRELPKRAVVVVGGARGADKLAEVEARGLGLEVEVYPARWEEEGRGAGFRRNERMLALPDVRGVLAFRMPGKSNGTDHMVRISQRAGVETQVIHP